MPWRPEDATASMVEELRKAELVRDRLESLQRLESTFPEGHDTRALLENLHLDRAFRAVVSLPIRPTFASLRR
jgi:hypothetical protein